MAHQKTIKIPADVEIQQSIFKIRFLGRPPEYVTKKGSPFRLYPAATEWTYYATQITLRALNDIGAKYEILQEVPPGKSGVSINFPLETILHDLPNEEVREEIVALALSRKDQGKNANPVYCGRTRERLPEAITLDRPGGTRSYRWKWERRKRTKRVSSFREQFPKLYRRMTDPNTRFVVSLGSGGLRMFAHPTIFRLIEALGASDAIEEIWGCSGGAIAGMAYALGADHQIIEKEGYDIYHRKYDLRLSPTAPEVLKNLVFNRLMPGTTVSLKGFVDIQNSMQESLARVAQHQKPTLPVFTIAYNMDMRRNEVLTPTDVDFPLYEGHIRRASLLNSVLASAAIPILFVPRVIKRGTQPNTYIDGSLFEEVPLTSVYYKWRVDQKHRVTKKKKLFVLSVNLFPYLSTWRVFGHFMARYIPVLELVGVLTRLADLARRARIDEQIRAINHDPHAEVVEVNLPRLSKFNFLDPQIIPTVIDKAHGTFYNQLLKAEADLS